MHLAQEHNANLCCHRVQFVTMDPLSLEPEHEQNIKAAVRVSQMLMTAKEERKSSNHVRFYRPRQH